MAVFHFVKLWDSTPSCTSQQSREPFKKSSSKQQPRGQEVTVILPTGEEAEAPEGECLAQCAAKEGRRGPGGACPPGSLSLQARGSVLAQDSLVHRRKSRHLQWQEEVVEESTTLKSERHGFKACT